MSVQTVAPASAVIHDFSNRLEWSARLSDEPAWVDFYRAIWPDMLAAVRVDANCDLQHYGVDRVILLPNGKQVLVDEKKREKDWGDILLEEWSVCAFDWENRAVLHGKKPGWAVDRQKQCHYIAYAIPSASKCYLLPFDLLRDACEHNADEWRANRRYYPKPARNDGYTTVSYAIPWDVLKVAMCREMCRKFGSTLELPVPIRHGNQMAFNWGAVTTNPDPGVATEDPFGDEDPFSDA